MTKKTVHVRKVDAELWIKFKAECVRRRLEMGAGLEYAIKKWIDEKAWFGDE